MTIFVDKVNLKYFNKVPDTFYGIIKIKYYDILFTFIQIKFLG